ncbi:MAG: NYN domain-containing protein [Methylacidiphilales bacterium]|nr:NYN domain-containing protein [Candidatus Methylacidiphilales bacterium]
METNSLSTEIAPPVIAKPRTIVYVDGFNWYYSVFKHHPEWKWLNVQSFFEDLRSGDNVVKIKVFSAIVDPTRQYSDTRDRQKRYFKTFKSLPKVELILGTYQDRTVTCRGKCKNQYPVPEEKKTDVNIAVNLLNDAIKNEADKLILVSGDSDLQPAIAWLKKNYPKLGLIVFIPSLPEEEKYRRASYYATIGVASMVLPLNTMGNHILPDPVVLPDGTKVSKPPTWV